MRAVLQQIPEVADTSSSLDNSWEETFETVNSLITSNVQLEILKLLHDIKEDLKSEKEDERIRLRHNYKILDNQIRPVRRLVSKYY